MARTKYHHEARKGIHLMTTTTVATIPAPNIQIAVIEIEGTAPYVQNKFSNKAREMMKATQEAGSVAKKGKKREPKDFDECFRQAQHISEDGWHGIPAPSFRAAMIRACKLCGFNMTDAKCAVFILPDGFDVDDGTPLVKIIGGKPIKHEAAVRNQTGVADIRIRPMWRKWGAKVRIQYDADVFSTEDVANLLMRAGMQVGIGEGRPFSKNSYGMGWGTFKIKDKAA